MSIRTRSLKSHPSSACHVEIDDYGTIVFVSYSTKILLARQVDDDSGRLYAISALKSGKFWDSARVYTPTTARQLSWFFSEYFEDVSYPAFKKIAESNDCQILMAYRKRGIL